VMKKSHLTDFDRVLISPIRFIIKLSGE
jgi:hypothetical protein